MNKLLNEIEKMELSVREYFLGGIILFLAGLLIGIVTSPKGEKIIGCNNGNHNKGNWNDVSEEESDED